MAWLATRVPPPVIAAVVGLLMWVDTRIFDGIGFSGRGYDVAGVTVAAVGMSFAVWGLREFGRARTTFDPHRLEETSALVTSGPYRFSRNPMYVGLASVLTGLGLILGELLALVFGVLLFAVLLTVLQIRPEERMLSAKFGADYDSYRGRVRRWL